MTQGTERRAAVVDNLRGQEAVNPVTRSVPSVGAPAAPRVPDTSFGSQIANQVSRFTTGRLAELQKKRQEQSMTDGQIAAMQGQSFESVEMEGDKWAMEGYRVVTAQTLSSSLLRAQEHEINNGAYEQSPDQYRQTLVGRIDAMTSEIPDEQTRKLARENLMSQMPGLVDSHMKQNLAFKEQQNFDALAGSVDTLSRDNSNTGALLDFASGESGVTSGLSQERRRKAVVQGVINSFQNNNPAAYAHLDAAGFFTTENLTASQLQQVNTAQKRYETRLRQQWNGALKEDMTALEDRVTNGDLDPLAAAEEQARVLAKHGMRMSASEGSQVYDRARAGVEFTEGTRGLNIQAAASSGNFTLQAELMQEAVIHQESRGNTNAVSPVGAVGVMQLMPATSMNPGFGVRNIFQVARSLGVPVAGENMATAQQLMRNAEVNKTLGTEYLATMLKRYNGNVEKALAAYNWGAGNADKWDGDHSKLPDETRKYIKNITKSWGDNRPDPQGERVAAEARLKQAREHARLGALEAMGPQMAQNDELFMRGEMDVSTWRNARNDMYQQWGMELSAERVNQEQQMMRSVAGDRIEELQVQQALPQKVQLETSIAAAEVQLAERQEQFANGEATMVGPNGEQVPMTLDDINNEYMGALIGAYTDSGSDLDSTRIPKAAAALVEESASLVKRALKGQEDRAMIANAESAGTVSSLPAPLQERAVQTFRKELASKVENFRAENPNATDAQIGAMHRQAEVEYLSQNGIVDPALQQQINLAASGRWIDEQGQAKPNVVVGMHMFASLMAEDPDLAYQYVPDREARGRMLAATHQVQSMFPDRDAFTDVDLSNRQDPVANAFYDAVQQVGLNVGQSVSPEVTAERVGQAIKLANKGNITNSVFGGFLSGGAAQTLIPSSLLMAGMSSTFDARDVNAARPISNEAVNNQFNGHVERFLEEIVPYMPGTSQQGAVSMALDYVRERGALIGNSYVMPTENEPGIRAQMFPGERVDNTAAVNTAVSEWLASDEAAAADPRLAAFAEEGWVIGGSEFGVTRINGQYVAQIIGVGNVVLPLRRIGDRYKANR